MNVLCVGDVVGRCGCKFLKEKLEVLKNNENIDITIVNGENSADRNGINRISAENIFSSGADIITTGNHAFHRNNSYNYFDSCKTLLRPYNLPQSCPGRGFCTYKKGKTEIAVVNLMGTVYMESLRSPFEAADEIIGKLNQKIIIIDFHAEATAEKLALGYYLDGKVSAMFGTHTHVQTADEQIMPKGTGYITDVGMVGAAESVLGVKIENAIYRMKDKMPVRFEQADGYAKLDAIVFNINEETGKTQGLKRIEIL